MMRNNDNKRNDQHESINMNSRQRIQMANPPNKNREKVATGHWENRNEEGKIEATSME